MLDGFAAGLGETFARACGTTGQALGLGRAAARSARAIVAAVVEKLDEAGITMGQAGQLGHRDGRRPST